MNSMTRRNRRNNNMGMMGGFLNAMGMLPAANAPIRPPGGNNGNNMFGGRRNRKNSRKNMRKNTRKNRASRKNRRNM